MNKTLSTLIIAAVAIGATACSDDKNTPYPSAPLSLSADYGVSESIFDVADVTAYVIDENGRVTATPFTKGTALTSTPSSPEGFLNAGATRFITLNKKINELIPNDNTYVGFLLDIKPKDEALSSGASTEMIAARHFTLKDRFNSEFINTTESFVQTSVDASFLPNACISLSNNCSFTFMENPNGTYAYAPLFTWSESVELISAGSLTSDEKLELEQRLFIMSSDFGTRHWSFHIADAMYKYRKASIIDSVAALVKSLKSDNKDVLRFKYLYNTNYFVSDEQRDNALITEFTINP